MKRILDRVDEALALALVSTLWVGGLVLASAILYAIPWQTIPWHTVRLCFD